MSTPEEHDLDLVEMLRAMADECRDFETTECPGFEATAGAIGRGGDSFVDYFDIVGFRALVEMLTGINIVAETMDMQEKQTRLLEAAQRIEEGWVPE